MIPYKPFAEHLRGIGVLASPSELHAQASAALCADKALPFEQWLQHISEDYCIENADDANLQHVMSAVFDYAKEQLAKEDYSFQLLLPQDDTGLMQRVEILAEWVATYLSGLGTAGLVTGALSADGQEFIQDLDKIARIDHDLEGLEAEELDFYEITEYVRSGVMLLYVEMNRGQSSPRYIN
jgi:uncharacterized protein YgfB (UPF0149 family)